VHLDLRKIKNAKENKNQEAIINEESGTLVFWLKNHHLQIFFKSNSGIAKTKALNIQNTFQTSWTGPKIDKVPNFRKDSIDWLCLLSIRYEPKKIENEAQFDALVKFILEYNDSFWKKD